jgi:hypothetical protein
VTVAVKNGSAWRLERQGTDLVVLRRAQVSVARQDLQRPEPQEEDPERRECERAENADPKRRLRLEAIGLLDAGRAG